MSKEKVRLIVKKNKNNEYCAEVQLANKKTMPLPKYFRVDENLNNKEVEIEREAGTIKEVYIEGKPLPRKQEQQKGKTHPPVHSNTRTAPSGQANINQRNAQTANPVTSEKKLNSVKYLPSDTKSVQGLSLHQIENFSLRLNKTPWSVTERQQDKFTLYKKDTFSLSTDINYDISGFIQKHDQALNQLGYDLKECKLKTNWRLIVGLGNESVYETSMTLHHIYGIPYIPGSAIKGSLRSYIIIHYFGRNEEDAMKNSDFWQVFGSTDKQGSVIFFDAYPEGRPNIDFDIMNPHYGDYYDGGNKPPADYLEPNPIIFLSVKDTNFKIKIGIKKSRNESIDSPIWGKGKILDLVMDKLTETLRIHGIGAKTAVGYGHFE